MRCDDSGRIAGSRRDLDGRMTSRCWPASCSLRPLLDPLTLGAGDRRRVPRARRRPARVRPAVTERLGPRLRDPRHEVAALDRDGEQSGHGRSLRPERHVPLDRSGAGRGPRLPHRSRLRPVGRAGVAGVGRRGPPRTSCVSGPKPDRLRSTFDSCGSQPSDLGARIGSPGLESDPGVGDRGAGWADEDRVQADLGDLGDGVGDRAETQQQVFERAVRALVRCRRRACATRDDATSRRASASVSGRIRSATCSSRSAVAPPGPSVMTSPSTGWRWTPTRHSIPGSAMACTSAGSIASPRCSHIR